MFGFEKKKAKRTEDARIAGYDFSSRDHREETAGRLFSQAKNARTIQEDKWVRLNDYYNFLHQVADEVREAYRESDIPWDPACVPDPYIMVESQIDPVVPEPEFRGRDDDMDSRRAKEREYAVRYVCEANRLKDMNTSNERRLKKLGDAIWKVYWDEEMPCGPNLGDIRIRDVPLEALYVDPSAGADGLQAAQYVAYVYRVHKLRFWRSYREDLAKAGLTLEELAESEYTERGGLFDMETTDETQEDDTVQVMELWFKHPEDEDGARAGEVGCTIQVGGHEVRYIPRYWERTGAQNKSFPFVHYWSVRDENGFYNKSELEAILPMVDAADRELANGLLNDAFTANDIVLMEEDALADGEEFTNVPGAVVKVRPNKAGAVARLGGLGDGRNCLPMVEWLMGQIQRTNRNYETNQGKVSSSVKTASELAMLRSDVDTQMEIKKADRNAGFERLYELIDWTALEFYDDERVLFLGGKKPEEAVVVHFNADNYAMTRPGTMDPESGELLEAGTTYWPRVDVTVNAGDGVIRSKAATLQALQSLAGVQPTQENYKLLSAMVEVLDIPQKQEILADWQGRFQQAVPTELVEALGADPELLALVQQAVNAKQTAQELRSAAPAEGGTMAGTLPGGMIAGAETFPMVGGSLGFMQ